MRRHRPVATAVAGVVTCLLAVGCRSTAPPETAASAPGAIHTGPQGDVPQFVVKCAYSHRAMDDPIVHPAMAGMSHTHEFFGNETTNADSTVESLQGRHTTCNVKLDTAAYWAPVLFDHGQPVEPLGLVAYYRPAPGVDATTLQTFPLGLKMLAGDSTATEAQPVEVAAWTCGNSSDLSSTPPTCPSDAPLRIRLTFADCWDGRNLDSDDHRSHVATSHDGRCPSSHPVPIPQLTLSIRYPVSGEGHDLTLASGSTVTVHGDFWNTWDEEELRSQVEHCLNRGVVCSVASNRAEGDPQPVL